MDDVLEHLMKNIDKNSNLHMFSYTMDTMVYRKKLQFGVSDGMLISLMIVETVVAHDEKIGVFSLNLPMAS